MPVIFLVLFIMRKILATAEEVITLSMMSEFRETDVFPERIFSPNAVNSS